MRTLINSAIIGSGLILLAASLVGCNVTEAKLADGTVIRNSRLAWVTGEYSLNMTNANGSVSFHAIKSNPDSETIKAVAQGVAAGLVK